MELRSCDVDPAPATAIEGPCERAPLDVQVLVRVGTDLLAAVDAAARQEKHAVRRPARLEAWIGAGNALRSGQSNAFSIRSKNPPPFP